MKMVDMVNPTILGSGNSGTDPILAALLASGGLGGGWGNGRNNGNFVGNGNFVTTTDLNTALNGQTQGQNTNQILQSLATIQQLIPENEGKVQLALAGQSAALSNLILSGQLAAETRNAGVIQAISSATADINTTTRLVKDTAEAGFAAVQLGLANLALQAAQNTAAINANTVSDGASTRALINGNTITALRDELAENRTAATVASGNLIINNNLQQQQQQQQAAANNQAVLHSILQAIHATNSNVIAGNTGAVTTGAQTSNPTNVNS
jgi:hypothetical protein